MGSFDAVPIPTTGPDDALRLLRSRFPELSDHFGKPENPEPGDPYVSYALFADHVLRRRTDKTLLRRVSAFINELAESRDHQLEDLLFIGILESLTQDAELTSSLYDSVGPKAQEALKAVYGRTPD